MKLDTILKPMTCFRYCSLYIDVQDPIRQVSNATLTAAGYDSQEQNTGEENFRGFEATLKYEYNAFVF